MSQASLSSPLELADPEAANLVRKELNRDLRSLNLMAAESYPTLAVREASAAPILGRYILELSLQCATKIHNRQGLEGYPGKRYHSGFFVLDEIELLCQRRAFEAFHLNENECAFRFASKSLHVCGAGQPRGGDITFNSIPYHTNPQTGIIDYEEVEALALQHRPRIITTGYSAYCRLIEFARLRSIAEKVNAYLHCDMAHICGLVASQLIPSPFSYCDVVTTTTYKTIRGPQGAMICSKAALRNRIDRALFPRFQAGVGFANILAMAVALRQLQTPESRKQQQRFLESAQVLAQSLLQKGYRLVSGGTDIHMMLIDLRDKGVGGSMGEKVLEMANIVCNRNSIPGDSNGVCSGLRLATPQMTIRGMDPSQGCKVAEFIHHGIRLTQKVSKLAGGHTAMEGANDHKKFETFIRSIEGTQEHSEIAELRTAVAEWMKQYPPPSFVEDLNQY